MVDESVFAIQDQQVDLIGQLYRNVYSPYITAKASYVEYDLSEIDGGGKGGGAGDEMGPMRSEFLDTAVFQQLVCDQQGKASVSFQLPDNVTDWRITAAALCGKKAGDNIGTAGNMITESDIGKHVHVEITKNEKIVDPLDYLNTSASK